MKTNKKIDIITFTEEIEAKTGFSLFPVQKFMLKCYYGMELDDSDEYISVPDIMNEKILYHFTEKAFLKWLYEEGRCNTVTTEGKSFRDFLMVMGRRASKSTITSILTNFETYKLLKIEDPVKYYCFPEGSKIHILNVALTNSQAIDISQMIKTEAKKIPFLNERLVRDTMTLSSFKTDLDIDQVGEPSIIRLAGGYASNALRGRNSIVVIMDEMAFFLDNSGRFSGSEVYKALTPSVASFGADGKVICISSPYKKEGNFYDLYKQSFDEPESTLMFKMYTSLVNPNVNSDFLKSMWASNEDDFMSEFGAEFSDVV